MITNLFSIFDPGSWLGLSLNWVRVWLGFITIRGIFWVQTRYKSLLYFKVLTYLNEEIKLLLSNLVGGKAIILLSIFLLILINNFLGLYPYIFTYRSHLCITLRLALPLWLRGNIFGLFNKVIHLLSHIVPTDTDYILIPFIACIELIRINIRFITLSVRLATNIIAGHLLLVLLRDQMYTIESIKLGILLVELLLITLEVGVSLVQAYVFSILTLLYIGEIN